MCGKLTITIVKHRKDDYRLVVRSDMRDRTVSVFQYRKDIGSVVETVADHLAKELLP